MAAPAPPGLTGLDADKLKLVQDLEIEMMTDMYSRLVLEIDIEKVVRASVIRMFIVHSISTESFPKKLIT